MNIGDIELLQGALAEWDYIHRFKANFIEENEDPDGNEPLCGYSERDEYLTSVNADLAQVGEILADAVRRVIC